MSRRNIFRMTAVLFASCFAAGSFVGCTSKPALPERPKADRPSAKIPVAPTDGAPISQVAPVSHVSAEPAPLSAVVTTSVPLPPPVTNIRPYKEWTEQEIAADALGRIGPQAVPALKQALTNVDADTRLQAAEVLGRMGPDAKEAVPDLIRLLDDPDDRVRRAATRTLGRIGPDAADAVPALMRSLLTPNS